MPLKRAGKINLTLSLIAFTTLVHAIESQVLCPETNLIKMSATKLDKAELFNENSTAYLVYSGSDVFVENNIPWAVGVNGVPAHSEKQALSLGTEMMQNTSYKKTKYAKVLGNKMFVCEYGPGDILAVGGSSDSFAQFKS